MFRKMNGEAAVLLVESNEGLTASAPTPLPSARLQPTLGALPGPGVRIWVCMPRYAFWSEFPSQHQAGSQPFLALSSWFCSLPRSQLWNKHTHTHVHTRPHMRSVPTPHTPQALLSQLSDSCVTALT